MQQESARTWWFGAAFGAVAGFAYVLTWGLVLPAAVVLFLIGCLVARNLSFPSGALVGLGGLWLGIAGLGELNCWSQNLLPNQGCESQGVPLFMLRASGVIAGGAAIGLMARWRRRREAGRVVA